MCRPPRPSRRARAAGGGARPVIAAAPFKSRGGSHRRAVCTAREPREERPRPVVAVASAAGRRSKQETRGKRLRSVRATVQLALRYIEARGEWPRPVGKVVTGKSPGGNGRGSSSPSRRKSAAGGTATDRRRRRAARKARGERPRPTRESVLGESHGGGTAATRAIEAVAPRRNSGGGSPLPSRRVAPRRNPCPVCSFAARHERVCAWSSTKKEAKRHTKSVS